MSESYFFWFVKQNTWNQCQQENIRHRKHQTMTKDWPNVVIITINKSGLKSPWTSKISIWIIKENIICCIQEIFWKQHSKKKRNDGKKSWERQFNQVCVVLTQYNLRYPPGGMDPLSSEHLLGFWIPVIIRTYLILLHIRISLCPAPSVLLEFRLLESRAVSYVHAGLFTTQLLLDKGSSKMLLEHGEE